MKFLVYGLTHYFGLRTAFIALGTIQRLLRQGLCPHFDLAVSSTNHASGVEEQPLRATHVAKVGCAVHSPIRVCGLGVDDA